MRTFGELRPNDFEHCKGPPWNNCTQKKQGKAFLEKFEQFILASKALMPNKRNNTSQFWKWLSSGGVLGSLLVFGAVRIP